MRVIGIDPGTAIVGYGIIDYDKNKYSVVNYGVILTSKDLSTEERLEIIYNEMDKILMFSINLPYFFNKFLYSSRDILFVPEGTTIFFKIFVPVKFNFEPNEFM